MSTPRNYTSEGYPWFTLGKRGNWTYRWWEARNQSTWRQRTARIQAKRTDLIPIFIQTVKYYYNPLAECLNSQNIAMVGIHVPLERVTTKTYVVYEEITFHKYKKKLLQILLSTSMIALLSNWTLPSVVRLRMPYEDNVCAICSAVFNRDIECLGAIWVCKPGECTMLACLLIFIERMGDFSITTSLTSVVPYHATTA